MKKRGRLMIKRVRIHIAIPCFHLVFITRETFTFAGRCIRTSRGTKWPEALGETLVSPPIVNVVSSVAIRDFEIAVHYSGSLIVLFFISILQISQIVFSPAPIFVDASCLLFCFVFHR